ncbi:hypothetical protein HPT27_05900 [Permianibacter sp. IMCC34836]|uniref:hypothetical protein n=1 Tax=Permianibacter fluminis TaxID=2738515 RepID=UPI001552434C|nr:hypothetical protein [Permianibacter fluminis]NQD36550.1 hypothetical protein [Permianibacter fluminis]
MHYEATVDEVRKLVWISYSGVLSLDVGLGLLQAARAKAGETGYPIVYDLRQARLHSSLLSLGEYAGKYIAPEAARTHYLPAVHLISPEDNVENWRFYERQAQMQGLKLRLFFDEAEAVRWLQQQMPTGAS